MSHRIMGTALMLVSVALIGAACGTEITATTTSGDQPSSAVDLPESYPLVPGGFVPVCVSLGGGGDEVNRTLVELEGFPAGATDERDAIERLTTFYTAEFARLELDPDVESRTTEMPFSATLINVEPGIYASVGIVQGVHSMLIRTLWAPGAIAEDEVDVAPCDGGVEP